jgi:hypothetical protein
MPRFGASGENRTASTRRLFLVSRPECPKTDSTYMVLGFIAAAEQPQMFAGASKVICGSTTGPVIIRMGYGSVAHDLIDDFQGLREWVHGQKLISSWSGRSCEGVSSIWLPISATR